METVARFRWRNWYWRHPLPGQRCTGPRGCYAAVRRGGSRRIPAHWRGGTCPKVGRISTAFKKRGALWYLPCSGRADRERQLCCPAYSEARAEAPTHSELLSSMRKVTQFTAFFIPPLGIILFLQAVMFRNDPLFDAVTATAAALLGMLPKGLVLLISVSLATGVARLARTMCWCRICFLWKIWHMWMYCAWIKQAR